MSQVFVAVDWINLEGRLTAHFSGDPTLQQMLDEELSGGHKVHARTAALLYGIDPGDAKTHMINLMGEERPAYDGGKRCRHLWHYGGKAKKMSQTFWLPLKECERIDAVLTATHPLVPEWWKALGDEIFGRGVYGCPKCGDESNTYGQCNACSIVSRQSPLRQWLRWDQVPTRKMTTPFGRRRLYLGRRSQSMNAAISQLPQSSGASMWYRTLGRLRGRGGWPTPSYPHRIITGTYDSFVGQCDSDKTEDMLQWIAWSCEQPWRELMGKRFPVDGKIGDNWRDYNVKDNPSGLTEVAYTPLSARWVQV